MLRPVAKASSAVNWACTSVGKCGNGWATSRAASGRPAERDAHPIRSQLAISEPVAASAAQHRRQIGRARRRSRGRVPSAAGLAAAGDRAGHQQRGRFDPIGDHRVTRGAQAVDADDFDHVGAESFDSGAERLEESAQIDNLRLAGSAEDDRFARGPARRPKGRWRCR